MLRFAPPRQLADESARSWVYRGMLDAIVYLDVKPGTMLETGELQAIFNVSRTPLREAMIQLARDGFVTLLPQRGSFVAPIDLDEVAKARFIRVCLEKEILGQACELCTDAAYREMKYLLDCQADAAGADDIRLLHDLDEKFHLVYFELCRRGNIWTYLRNGNLHYRRYRILNIPMRGMKEFTYEHHEKLFRALKARDRTRAAVVIEQHLDTDNWTASGMVDEHPEWFTASGGSKFSS